MLRFSCNNESIFLLPGDEQNVQDFPPEECLRILASNILSAAGDCCTIFKALSPNEAVPTNVGTLLDILHHLPTVVNWLRRSACRRGITTALSLISSHYEGFDLATVTSGYPPASPGKKKTQEAEEKEIDANLLKCAPYADRVLSMVILDKHQSSQTAPEDQKDSPPSRIDA